MVETLPARGLRGRSPSDGARCSDPAPRQRPPPTARGRPPRRSSRGRRRSRASSILIRVSSHRAENTVRERQGRRVVWLEARPADRSIRVDRGLPVGRGPGRGREDDATMPRRDGGERGRGRARSHPGPVPTGPRLRRANPVDVGFVRSTCSSRLPGSITHPAPSPGGERGSIRRRTPEVIEERGEDGGVPKGRCRRAREAWGQDRRTANEAGTHRG